MLERRGSNEIDGGRRREAQRGADAFGAGAIVVVIQLRLHLVAESFAEGERKAADETPEDALHERLCAIRKRFSAIAAARLRRLASAASALRPAAVSA